MHGGRRVELLRRARVIPFDAASRPHAPAGRAAIVMLARDPHEIGKTRLARGAAPAEHAALRAALFDDTLEAVLGLAGVDHVVCCDPRASCAALGTRIGGRARVLPQREGDLGHRMLGAIDDTLRLGAGAVVLVGSDLPDLPAAALADAVCQLQPPGDRSVIGPTGDGGYYLIGLKAAHPGLFEAVDWGTTRVLDQTLARAAGLGLPVALVQTWRDIDDDEDLLRLEADESDGAVRTRRWLASHRDTLRQPMREGIR